MFVMIIVNCIKTLLLSLTTVESYGISSSSIMAFTLNFNLKLFENEVRSRNELFRQFWTHDVTYWSLKESVWCWKNNYNVYENTFVVSFMCVICFKLMNLSLGYFDIYTQYYTSLITPSDITNYSMTIYNI